MVERVRLLLCVIIASITLYVAGCGTVPRVLYHSSTTTTPVAVIDSLNSVHGTHFNEWWRGWDSQSFITNDSTLVTSYIATERHRDTLYVMTIVHAFNDTLVTVRFRKE